MSKQKRENFVRLAEARTNKILEMVRLLGNLSNTSNYSYTKQDVEKIFNTIEKELQNNLSQEVKSSHIGELVMEKLKNLDEIAYVRYAAVYRKFKDITTFIDFLNTVN